MTSSLGLGGGAPASLSSLFSEAAVNDPLRLVRRAGQRTLGPPVHLHGHPGGRRYSVNGVIDVPFDLNVQLVGLVWAAPPRGAGGSARATSTGRIARPATETMSFVRPS